MTEQTELELPPQPELPPLPDPPAYWPTIVSKYSRIKLQGRFLCHVCVKLCIDSWDGPPRRATYRRKGLPTDKPADQLDLCWDHHRQYLNRDNEARVKAHVAPLAGGG
jgi:hypothetical protein